LQTATRSAALLEGAAEGLRRRVGLGAWPHLRRVEADLVAQVRQRLGAARFDQVFADGSGPVYWSAASSSWHVISWSSRRTRRGIEPGEEG